MKPRLHLGFWLWLVVVVAGACSAAEGNQGHYAGSQTCFACHTEIAKTQSETAMANSWHGALPSSFAAKFAAAKKEGPSPELVYEVRRIADRLQYSTTVSTGVRLSLPVEAVVGGKRHGFSFLERVNELGGIPLERPALVEARYAYNAEHRALLLSPGFEHEKPSNYEDSLGRTLSPGFEKRCLACHGQPGTLGAAQQGGVRCESCHGAAAEHVASLNGNGLKGAFVRPASLKGEKELEVCGQCHTGLSDRSDPLPDDLLVSNQVPALSNSECFLQSGHRVTCSDCHNPHQDSAKVAERTVATCLGCHSGAGAQRAAICPVNARTECIACHMPAVEKDSFLMTDHWIRVHPEQGVLAQKHDAGGTDDPLRSHVSPKHEYLRLIVVENRQAADTALQRLTKGEPFSLVAHQVSIDPTAPGGGYIGDMDLSQMDPKLALAAAQLSPGSVSPVIELGNRFLILYRMPRDFKWQANQLFVLASALREKGDLKGAAEKDQQALDIYPHFLRALILMGTTVAEAGDPQRASAILQFTAQFYPKDPTAQFDYALTLSRSPSQQIAGFQHALELDPAMTAGYESLGAALFASGQQEGAIAAFRKGLLIDPLSASLYYNLSLALDQQGDAAGAKRALSLAQQLDAKIMLKRPQTTRAAH